MQRVIFVVTPKSNALLSSHDYNDVTHTLRPRLWFGAQTAYTDNGWLKQLKRFTAGRFVLAETKQFRFSFVSIARTTLCQLCGHDEYWRFVGTDAPKLSCPPVGAGVGDANVCVRCDVNGKPRPTSTLWVVDANGTSLAEGQVLDDYWTFSTVRHFSALIRILIMQNLN